MEWILFYRLVMNPSDNIRPFKVTFSAEEIDNFLSRVRAVVSCGTLIPSTNNQELEALFASFIGTRYAVAVSTGTAALELLCRAYELSGYEVLVPANTNYATVEAVMRAGGKAILYDSDLFPDFESIRRHLTPLSRAVVIVHIGGYITPDIHTISNFCKEQKLLLIEDASHAHGSKYNQRSAGTFGAASAFSLFATKVLTTSEGGIIVTDDLRIRELAMIFRDQGKDVDGRRNIVFGSAWRMSEILAALGVVQMPQIQQYLKRNNDIASYYSRNIEQSKLRLWFDNKAYYSGHKFIVQLNNNNDRESLKAYLIGHNITPGKGVYDVPIHLQPALSGLDRGIYPKSEAFANNHLCLPIWKGMTNIEIEKVTEVVNRWQKT